ncbi:hypothetical protein [Pseudomonas marincola]|uniref:hypothetical protein n=1 Tax=Pseudomonas marincola TaxID=437900 RepID=UPI0008E78488|nr:hypothetical protein [Pseudomonas marincola]SFU11510.1 hypothetical protein SAMN05216264_11298 [Pseudomonas marincola]
MSFFTNPLFDSFVSHGLHYPIRRLSELQSRAKHLLHGRTDKEIENARSTIYWLLEDYFNDEKEYWIRSQLECGGHILGYLHEEERTESALRELITNNTNPDIEGVLDFPQEENTKEVDALEHILMNTDIDDADFPNANAYEYLAVLALDLINRAVEAVSDRDFPDALKDDMPMVLLAGIGNDAVDITEVVCIAESHKARQYAEIKHLAELAAGLVRHEIQLGTEADVLAKKKVSMGARKAAGARHSEANTQKLNAQTEWDSVKGTYSSIAAFARYRHKAYAVTERTLYGWIIAHRKTKA